MHTKFVYRFSPEEKKYYILLFNKRPRYNVISTHALDFVSHYLNTDITIFTYVSLYTRCVLGNSFDKIMNITRILRVVPLLLYINKNNVPVRIIIYHYYVRFPKLKSRENSHCVKVAKW